MVTGETGRRLPTVLIPVAEVHITVHGVVIVQVRPLVVPGVLGMTLMSNYAIPSLVQVTLFLISKCRSCIYTCSENIVGDLCINSNRQDSMYQLKC